MGDGTWGRIGWRARGPAQSRVGTASDVSHRGIGIGLQLGLGCIFDAGIISWRTGGLVRLGCIVTSSDVRHHSIRIGLHLGLGGILDAGVICCGARGLVRLGGIVNTSGVSHRSIGFGAQLRLGRTVSTVHPPRKIPIVGSEGRESH